MSNVTLPDLPKGISAGLIHVEGGKDCTDPIQWRDYLAVRVHSGRQRPIAELTLYPDGRVFAKRHHAVMTSADYAMWAGIVRAIGGTSDDYFNGVVMAGNPVEIAGASA